MLFRHLRDFLKLLFIIPFVISLIALGVLVAIVVTIDNNIKSLRDNITLQ